MARTREPRWDEDGNRRCSRCQRYLPKSSFNRPPGGKYDTYCKACRKAKDRERSKKRFAGRYTPDNTAILYGAIGNADREAAERRGWMGRDVFYLGGKHPIRGRIAGVRETLYQGLQVWVDFSDAPLRVSTTDQIGVALIRADHLAVRAPKPEGIRQRENRDRVAAVAAR